jgi:hypothetical protein
MIEMDAVNTVKRRSELDQLIASLPGVKSGFKRVFRGQAEVFDALLASAHRPGRAPDTRRQVLKTIAQTLLNEFRGSEAIHPYDYALWTELIAQQYSNGSPYLDVTSRLDVAIWFALNDFDSHECRAVFGEPGPFDPEQDRVAHVPCFTPHPGQRAMGYLLILDLPVTPNGLPRSHGDLVDLTALPPGLERSTRISNQSAALVYAEKSFDGGSLTSFLACPPIELSINFLNRIPTTTTAAFLFPAPRNDEWYRRLLQLPLWPQLDDVNRLELGQSFTVPLYAWDASSLQAVTDPLIALTPTLLAPTLRKVTITRAGQEYAPLLPSGCISVLIEEPIYLMTPPVGDAAWDYEALWTGTPTTARAKSPTGESLQEVKLSHTYFEFSPLELGDWLKAETDESTFHAGALLSREDGTFTIWRTQRNFPGGPTASGPFVFEYEPVKKAFFFRDHDSSLQPATSAGVAFKTLLICLTLLLRLSPEPVRSGITWTSDAHKVAPLVGDFYLQQSTFEGEQIYLFRRNYGSDHFQPRLLGIAVEAARPETPFNTQSPQTSKTAK